MLYTQYHSFYQAHGFFFQAEDGIRDLVRSRGSEMCIRDRVTAAPELRLQRKLKSGFTEEDFINRESNQIPEEEKKKRADFIFSNDTSIEDLSIKFNLLLLTLGIK